MSRVDPLLWKLPPQNLEAEAALLGSVLLETAVLDECVAIVRPADFYRDVHETLWREMSRMHGEGKPVDAITLIDELTRSGLVSQFGGRDELLLFLAELANGVPHAANALYHAGIVRQKADARGLAEAANEILRDVYSDSHTADALLARAEQRVLDVSSRRVTSRSAPVSDALVRLLDRMDHATGGVTGLRTPWDSLDSLTDGLLPGKVYMVAGRPSMGKSAAVQNIALHTALTCRAPVLFVSLEVPDVDVAMRLLAIGAGVSGRSIKRGWSSMPEFDRERILAYAPVLMAAPIQVHYAHDLTPHGVGAEARRVHRSPGGLGLIVIDYLQLMDATEEASREPRQVQVAKMSRAIKGLAMALSVPVLLVSQLNREAEKREDRRPRMADLRESGSLEQDSDVVILVHRPEYYDANDQPGVAELIVAKNRDGDVGTVRLTWDGPTFRLLDAGAADYIPPTDGF